MNRSLRIAHTLAPLAALLALSGCFALYPGPSGDYDVAFASDYWKGATLDRPSKPPESLSLDQLYAAHRYGLNKMHPARSMGGEYARRGAAAVPDLTARLGAQRSFGQVGSILEAFQAMQRAGSYDVRSDPALVALIQSKAAAYKDPYTTLRDLADELETGTRIPTWFQPYWRKPFEGRGQDYDDEFAEDYCRGCDYRAFVAGLEGMPLARLYAVQRYQGEAKMFGRNVDHAMARRGAEAIPFLKQKLAGPGSDIMVWTIMSTLELMRDLGTYEVADDAELMQLAQAAVLRVAPEHGPLTVQLDRIRSGTRVRDIGERLPVMGG